MLGAAGSAGGTPASPDSVGLSSQCTKSSPLGVGLHKHLQQLRHRPPPTQPKAKTPCKAPGQPPWTTTTPPPPPLLLQPPKWGNGTRTRPKMPRPSDHLSPALALGPRALLWEDMAGSTVPGLSPRRSVPETPGSGGVTFLERRQFPNLLPVSEASVSVYVPFFLHPRAALAGTAFSLLVFWRDLLGIPVPWANPALSPCRLHGASWEGPLSTELLPSYITRGVLWIPGVLHRQHGSAPVALRGFRSMRLLDPGLSASRAACGGCLFLNQGWCTT